MPRRSKQKDAPDYGRELKIRLPDDVWQRVEAQAKHEGRPFNRIIINDLAAAPDLRLRHELAETVGDLQNTLARYSANIVMHDLSDQLLQALDAALAAQGSAQQAALDKLRVIRSAMLKTKTTTK